MNNGFEKAAEQAAAFQKLWMESASKMVQAALSATPKADPDALRQVRTDMFQALAQSWEEFLRSPQFLESMKQWTENAVSFRKMSSDALAKMRNEIQAPSRDDIDTVMLAVRHLETRLLDRLDGLSAQLAALNSQSMKARPTGKRASRRATRSATAGQGPARGGNKEAT